MNREHGTLKYRKVTILRLSPRQSIVASTVTGPYVGTPLPGHPTGATKEGWIKGKAVIGVMDVNNDYILCTWDMTTGRDWVCCEVWKGATTTANCGPRAISSGEWSLSP